MPLWRVGHGRRLTRFVLWSRSREIRQARVLKRYHQPKPDACRVHNIKEPPGISRTDGKCPDGRTLIPWQGGRCLLWDATVTDTVAPSYLPQTSSLVGAAAELVANRKISKYSELTTSYHFVPIAFETMGPINSSGVALIKELGRRMTLITGDIKETSYLFQRLSVAIQRLNAVALRGSFLQPDIVKG